MKKNRGIKILKTAAAVLFWTAVWAGISVIVKKELLIPTPWKTLAVLAGLAQTAAFWKAVGLSLVRILAGFALGMLLGTAGGILTERFSLFRVLVQPLMHLIRSVPVASFIILALVWIRTDALPIFIAFLMVLPLFWDGIANGMTLTNRQELEMGRVLGLSRERIWSEIRIPALAPHFRAACVTGIGFAWKSGVAAEVICRPVNSLGNLLQTAKITLETPEVFALTLTVVCLSLMVERLFRFFWKEGRK